MGWFTRREQLGYRVMDVKPVPHGSVRACPACGVSGEVWKKRYRAPGHVVYHADYELEMDGLKGPPFAYLLVTCECGYSWTEKTKSEAL